MPQNNATSNAVQSKSNASDFSAMYNPSSSVVNPQIATAVLSENEADVFFRIRTQEIKNALANPLNKEFGLYVKYYLRRADDFHIVDTASMRFSFNVLDGEYVYGHFKIGIRENIRYKLVVDFVNMQYNVRKRLLCDIKNTQGFHDGNFMVKTLSGEILFSNVVRSGQPIRVFGPRNKETVDVEYYAQKPYVPLSPYWSSSLKSATIPDSVFRYRFGDTISFEAPGLYALGSTQKNDKFGIVVTKNLMYPNVTTVADIDLSNKGLRADGTINYLSTTFSDAYVTLFPDEMEGHSKNMVMEQRKSPVEFPKVVGVENSLRWKVSKDKFHVEKDTSNFVMYDGKAKLDGNLVITSKGLHGEGTTFIDKAMLESKDFVYNKDVFDADTADFSIFGANVSDRVFDGSGQKAHIDFLAKQGDFTSNGDMSEQNFPYNKYKCKADKTIWYMDKEELAFTTRKEILDNIKNIDPEQDLCRLWPYLCKVYFRRGMDGLCI